MSTAVATVMVMVTSMVTQHENASKGRDEGVVRLKGRILFTVAYVGMRNYACACVTAVSVYMFVHKALDTNRNGIRDWYFCSGFVLELSCAHTDGRSWVCAR